MNENMLHSLILYEAGQNRLTEGVLVIIGKQPATVLQITSSILDKSLGKIESEGYGE